MEQEIEKILKEFDSRYIIGAFGIDYVGKHVPFKALKEFMKYSLTSMYQKGKEESKYCNKEIHKNGICKVRKDCHLCDWRSQEQWNAAITEAIQIIPSEEEGLIKMIRSLKR